MLAPQQIKNQSRMFMNQGQEAGSIETNQRQRRQSLCIAAVEFARFNQIAIKKQFALPVANPVSYPCAEFNQTELNHIHSLDLFTLSVNK